MKCDLDYTDELVCRLCALDIKFEDYWNSNDFKNLNYLDLDEITDQIVFEVKRLFSLDASLNFRTASIKNLLYA